MPKHDVEGAHPIWNPELLFGRQSPVPAPVSVPGPAPAPPDVLPSSSRPSGSGHLRPFTQGHFILELDHHREMLFRDQF